MSESAIGIKIANGEFYPVIEGNDRISKKLILTTVNDNQESVKIELYKGFGTSIENASFIGSLFIEDLLPKISGEPDIELILGVDEEGNLNATASDKQSGDMQSLSVNLDTVSEPENYDLPDFELNEELDNDLSDENFFNDVSTSDFNSSQDDWDSRDSAVTVEEETVLTGKKKKSGRVHPILLVAFILAGLAIIGLLIILLLRSFPGEDTPPLQSDSGQVQTVVETEPPSVPAEKPSVSADADTEKVPPVAVEAAEIAVEAVETAEAEEIAVSEENAVPALGFWYDIKYGDTLWDLSNAFYRTPWLYGKLARENNIKDPDLIYWGTQLYIPE